MGRRTRSRQAEEQPKTYTAMLHESFAPAQLDVSAPDSEELGAGPAFISLRLLVGPIGPGAYVQCKEAQLTPEVAVQIGEYLVAEGRRLSTGLVTAGAIDLADLRKAA